MTPAFTICARVLPALRSAIVLISTRALSIASPGVDIGMRLVAGGCFGECSRQRLVERREVGGVPQVHLAFHDVGERGAGSLQRRFDLLLDLVLRRHARRLDERRPARHVFVEKFREHLRRAGARLATRLPIRHECALPRAGQT